MASITIGGLKLALVRDQGNDGEVHLYIELHGIVSMVDVLLYLVIDGVMWFTLFAVLIL